jgi:hypothetical protein
MIRILCVNPQCMSPTATFDVDETQLVEPGGGIAQPFEDGAERMVITCPYCQVGNVIWLYKPKKKRYPRFE